MDAHPQAGEVRLLFHQLRQGVVVDHGVVDAAEHQVAHGAHDQQAGHDELGCRQSGSSHGARHCSNFSARREETGERGRRSGKSGETDSPLGGGTAQSVRRGCVWSRRMEDTTPLRSSQGVVSPDSNRRTYPRGSYPITRRTTTKVRRARNSMKASPRMKKKRIVSEAPGFLETPSQAAVRTRLWP